MARRRVLVQGDIRHAAIDPCTGVKRIAEAGIAGRVLPREPNLPAPGKIHLRIEESKRAGLDGLDGLELAARAGGPLDLDGLGLARVEPREVRRAGVAPHPDRVTAWGPVHR